MGSGARAALAWALLLLPAVLPVSARPEPGGATPSKPSAEKKPQAPARAPFTKPLFVEWWNALSQRERDGILAKHPSLASGFHERDKEVRSYPDLVETIAQNLALGDWWKALSRDERKDLLERHPALRGKMEKSLEELKKRREAKKAAAPTR